MVSTYLTFGDNFKTYRNLISNSNSNNNNNNNSNNSNNNPNGCIPYLGLLLADLTLISCGNKKYVNVSLNLNLNTNTNTNIDVNNSINDDSSVNNLNVDNTEFDKLSIISNSNSNDFVSISKQQTTTPNNITQQQQQEKEIIKMINFTRNTQMSVIISNLHQFKKQNYHNLGYDIASIQTALVRCKSYAVGEIEAYNMSRKVQNSKG